jgi:SAM-dependent methyltransferase
VSSSSIWLAMNSSWEHSWDSVLSTEWTNALPTFEAEYPSMQLIAFLRHHLHFSATSIDWLEIGPGSGKQLLAALMLLDRIESLGIADVSQVALERTSALLAEHPALVKSEIQRYLVAETSGLGSIPSASYSVVHADSSLYYASFESLCSYVEDIYRILKPGGIARIVLKSSFDRYAVPANAVEGMMYAYYVRSSGHWEDGMLVTCLSRDVIIRLFSRYGRLLIGRIDYSFTGNDGNKSFWIITAYK